MPTARAMRCLHAKKWLVPLRKLESHTRRSEPNRVYWCGRCGGLRYAGEKVWNLPNLAGGQDNATRTRPRDGDDAEE